MSKTVARWRNAATLLLFTPKTTRLTRTKQLRPEWKERFLHDRQRAASRELDLELRAWEQASDDDFDSFESGL